MYQGLILDARHYSILYEQFLVRASVTYSDDAK